MITSVEKETLPGYLVVRERGVVCVGNQNGDAIRKKWEEEVDTEGTRE